MIHLITRHAYNAERKGCRMKIEKVNENQIRCTLTREDLVSRELKISELAYGTEKAKTLFRDMMRQANFEFGFEAEDIPLMIEAIPLNAECIVLIITKVEDPEELDTRFSRFAPSLQRKMTGTKSTVTTKAVRLWTCFVRFSPRSLKLHQIIQKPIFPKEKSLPGFSS